MEISWPGWILCSLFRHVEGLCREARHKETWEDVVEGKHDISSFRTCTKQERIPAFKVLFTSLSKFWGNATIRPRRGLCMKHKANLFLPAMTILGTLRRTLPLPHRVCVAGIWLEGFSFSWCGEPDLFQVLLNLEELLAGNKQFSSIQRRPLRLMAKSCQRPCCHKWCFIVWFVITYQDHVMASFSTVVSTLPISTAVIRLNSTFQGP